MITLEHVRLLESRVEKALAFIDKLKNEKTQLETKLAGYEKRVGDLEENVRSFQTEQGRIEEGIIHALEKLNRFEDTMSSPTDAERKKPANRQPVSEPAAVIVEESPNEAEEPLVLNLSPEPDAPKAAPAEEAGTVPSGERKSAVQGIAVKTAAPEAASDKATEPEFWDAEDDTETKPEKSGGSGELDIF